jgi:hypothetical protein
MAASQLPLVLVRCNLDHQALSGGFESAAFGIARNDESGFAAES